jgi:hypothetical protein
MARGGASRKCLWSKFIGTYKTVKKTVIGTITTENEGKEYSRLGGGISCFHHDIELLELIVLFKIVVQDKTKGNIWTQIRRRETSLMTTKWCSYYFEDPFFIWHTQKKRAFFPCNPIFPPMHGRRFRPFRH